MHQLEPYYRWLTFYDSSKDKRSPFFGKEYNFNEYSETIYGYYIDPAWDFIGSETLYIKILFIDYSEGFAIIELIGEWNDALHNDIMHLKRNIIDHLISFKVYRFILIGENVLNFHGSDDCYYEEWFDDIGDGWIACINFHDFVMKEMSNYAIDQYLVSGGDFSLIEWRTYTPQRLFQIIEQHMTKRLGM